MRRLVVPLPNVVNEELRRPAAGLGARHVQVENIVKIPGNVLKRIGEPSAKGGMVVGQHLAIHVKGHVGIVPVGQKKLGGLNMVEAGKSRVHEGAQVVLIGSLNIGGAEAGHLALCGSEGGGFRGACLGHSSTFD